jgi:hypothetical protein
VSSNSNGAVPYRSCREGHIDKGDKLKAFDLLPGQIRRALAYSETNFCPLCVLKSYHRCGSIGAILVAIEDANAAYIKAHRALFERGL